MRIITGIYGGRTIISPKGSGTRPMTDKMRAALFDSLGSIEGLSVLDAYAGSGAVGIEALSRGATQATGIEQARQAIKAIQANLKTLEIDWGYQLIQTKVESWLARDPQDHYDFIIADPPYELIKDDVLEKLSVLLKPNGIMAVSQTSAREALKLSGLEIISTKTYGDSALVLYRVMR